MIYQASRDKRLSKSNWLAKATFGTVFVGAAAALYAGCQTKRQADLAEEAQRPFVGTPRLKVLPHYLALVTTNTGAEAAVGFKVITFEGKSTIDRIGDICTRESNSPFYGANAAYTLIPKDEWVSRFDAMNIKTRPEDAGYHAVYGCAVYSTPHDGVRHTGFFGDFDLAGEKIIRQDFFAVDAN